MSPRVLVVDDEAPIRAFLRRVLERFPVRLSVQEAETAEEALGLLQDSTYEVIIADYRLAGKTGIDVLREAAKLSPEGGRILLTGYHEADIAIAAINEGRVHRYIEKPLDLESFQKTLAQVLVETDAVMNAASAALEPKGIARFEATNAAS
ncbi:MAG: response regulator [Thermoplasmatota archaeon]